MHKSDQVGIDRVGTDSGWYCARLGIPKKSKNKQMFTDRVRNDLVWNDSIPE